MDVDASAFTVFIINEFIFSFFLVSLLQQKWERSLTEEKTLLTQSSSSRALVAMVSTPSSTSTSSMEASLVVDSMVEVSNFTLTNAVHFLVFFCKSLEKKFIYYITGFVCVRWLELLFVTKHKIMKFHIK